MKTSTDDIGKLHQPKSLDQLSKTSLVNSLKESKTMKPSALNDILPEAINEELNKEVARANAEAYWRKIEERRAHRRQARMEMASCSYARGRLD